MLVTVQLEVLDVLTFIELLHALGILVEGGQGVHEGGLVPSLKSWEPLLFVQFTLVAVVGNQEVGAFHVVAWSHSFGKLDDV